MEETPPANPKPKLRWYQFSLRTLFIVVTLFACLCSWFAVMFHQALEQRDAVEGLHRLGGFVGYDFQLDKDGVYEVKTPPPGPAWLCNLLGVDFFDNVGCVAITDNERLTDADLKLLRDLRHLKNLNLYKTLITDAGLQNIKELCELRDLNLRGDTRITDTGLEHLKGLKQLQTLSLDDTRVTDAGLKNLENLEQLEYLSLENTPVTDAGLEHLKRLTQLQTLHVERTCITDAGLKHLQSLKKLYYISLHGTQVTDDGIAELQKSLPDCRIVQ